MKTTIYLIRHSKTESNYIDIEKSKESLLESLQKYPGTVIFVSHERDFVEKLATKVFNIEDLLTA